MKSSAMPFPLLQPAKFAIRQNVPQFLRSITQVCVRAFTGIRIAARNRSQRVARLSNAEKLTNLRVVQDGYKRSPANSAPANTH